MLRAERNASSELVPKTIPEEKMEIGKP